MSGLPVPTTVYATFAGQINPDSVQKIFSAFASAIGGGVKHAHILFQSTGGYVSDGICLYNYFRALPIDLTLYNCGDVSSIGVIAYLGAKHRKTSAHACFMVHRTRLGELIGANADRLQAVAEGLLMDDKRVEEILHNHIKLSQEQWEAHKFHDVRLDAAQGVTAGIADAIEEWKPPSGSKIFSI